MPKTKILVSNAPKRQRRRSSGPHYDVRRELKPQIAQADSSVWGFKNSALNQQDTYTMEMIYDQPFIVDGSGTSALVVGNNPASTANWASAVALFDEYRVLAMKLEYKPVEFNGSAITQAPMVTVLDYDTAAALTGYTLAAQYSSQKEFRGTNSWKRTAYMSGVENSGFSSTGSPVNTFWIKVYTTGNTATTGLGRYVVTFCIQFRGKGI